MFGVKYSYFLLFVIYSHIHGEELNLSPKNDTIEVSLESTQNTHSDEHHYNQIDLENYQHNFNSIADDRQDKISAFSGYYQPSLLSQSFIVPSLNPFTSNGLLQTDNLGNHGVELQSGQNSRIGNSPVYFIRLPPSPYAFLPNLGYMAYSDSLNSFRSNPTNHHPSLNLPLNFITNGKPQTIYQYGSPINPFYYPNAQNFYPQLIKTSPTFNRPKPIIAESKVMNLKSSFPYNGRPEDVYVIPNHLSSSPSPGLYHDRPSTSYY